MRTSHKEIRRRIRERMDSISDEEFFTSKEFASYLTDIADNVLSHYERSTSVFVHETLPNNEIAYTDFTGIYLSAGNEITRSFPTRKLRALSLEGLSAHETAHLLFTDSDAYPAYLKKLQKGAFYPRMPKPLKGERKDHARELLKTMKEASDTTLCAVIESTAESLFNIVEDGYVDRRYSHLFRGVPAQGISMNNRRFLELAGDIPTMEQDGKDGYLIIENLLLQYLRAGDINNRTGYTGAYLDTFRECLAYIEPILLESTASDRCFCVSQILITLWPYLKSGAATLSANAPSGVSSVPVSKDAYKEYLRKQLPPTACAPRHTLPPPEDGNTKNSNSCQESSPVSQSEQNPTGETDATMETLLKRIASGEVMAQSEKALCENLQHDAQVLPREDLHRNVQMTVHRKSDVSSREIQEYKAIAAPLLALSRRLCKQVTPLLQSKRDGGKLTGLLMGKRLNQKALYRTDGRIFASPRLPTEPLSMAVALLCDESGSMEAMGRISQSKAAAILIQDFCESMNIPLMILGHTALNGKVELFSYADFDSVDRMDRYRLMQMESRYCNRDGSALRFIGEKLLREPADLHLLLLITDGVPNDDGYTGQTAEADLQAIRQDLTRRGARLYAAAIGDDRENIERIYGSCFLDVSDLSRLPVLLTKIIAENIPKNM